MPEKDFPKGQIGGFLPPGEIITPIQLSVKGGPIPEWVQGVLYRMGPHKFKLGELRLEHWFDGLSYVSRFEIRNGSVEFRSAETSKDVEELAVKNAEFMTFGRTDPCKSIFKRVHTTFSSLLGGKGTPNNLTVNVTITPLFPTLPADRKALADARHAEVSATLSPASKRITYLVAKTDANVLQQLDPVTMAPVDVPQNQDGANVGKNSRFTYTDLNAELKGFLSAAHHQYDPTTGQYYNVVAEPAGPALHYRVFEINPDGKTRILHSVPHPMASYLHSFALTKRHVVLILQPFYVRYMGIGALTAASYLDSLAWDGKLPTIFHVLDRKSGQLVQTAESDRPLFFFHTCNSWDQEDKDGAAVVIELVGYNSPDIVYKLHISNICPELSGEGPRPPLDLSEDIAAIRRYIVPLNSSAKATYKELPFRGVDLPRFNSNYIGIRTRFVYAFCNFAEDSPKDDAPSLFKAIAKYDTEAGTKIMWQASNQYPGEPIFVARPGGTDEDDGVVLSVVLNGNTGTSFLLILDGRTFTEIARAEVPQAVPFGFHGSFVGAEPVMDSLN